MEDTITLYRTEDSQCPYLPQKISRMEFIQVESIPGEFYEVLLSNGFRRSGKIFYRNTCPDCDECRMMRIPVSLFKPSASQKRAVRKNPDIHMSVVPAVFREDVYTLFHRYSLFKHGKKENEKNFQDFLCISPLDTRLTLYHAKDTLVGAGWLDVLPEGLSSVYFIFDPNYSRRSLGIYSIVQEIELTKSMGLSYYYLGFVVEDSPKMSYKAQFHPHERLRDGRWITYT